ncbi:hypothetical protein X769_33225 [Mesorhizobium sp. LSJC268A00]|nr:hypothetical protein X773_11780 [Mesorhizobium sp. LSJC285A00]ESW94319.1 hypothetical protein X769_33225 [Mesorhizobium sp. LSJC268A00]
MRARRVFDVSRRVGVEFIVGDRERKLSNLVGFFQHG